jgi:hypothetical protein
MEVLFSSQIRAALPPCAAGRSARSTMLGIGAHGYRKDAAARLLIPLVAGRSAARQPASPKEVAAQRTLYEVAPDLPYGYGSGSRSHADGVFCPRAGRRASTR